MQADLKSSQTSLTLRRPNLLKLKKERQSRSQFIFVSASSKGLQVVLKGIESEVTPTEITPYEGIYH